MSIIKTTTFERKVKPEFQQYEIRNLYNSLMSGKSISLIGVGSVGKSNLLRNMSLDEIKRWHTQEEAKQNPQKNRDFTRLITILLDPHNLVFLEGDALKRVGVAWSGYELMLTRLQRVVLDYYPPNPNAFTPAPDNPHGYHPVANQVSTKRKYMFANDILVAQSGLRHLEHAVYEILSNNPEWKLVFMLDEVENFRQFPPQFFMSLRGLRDMYKGHLMYVTTSRTSIKSLLIEGKENKDEVLDIVEGFLDLLTEQYIKPLDWNSTVLLLEELVVREGHNYVSADWKEFVYKELYNYTGGHAGLLKSSYPPAYDYIKNCANFNPVEFQNAILADGKVNAECSSLITSLTKRERETLFVYGRDNHILEEQAWKTLQHKNFIQAHKDGPYVQFPIMLDYMRRYPGELIGFMAENLPK